MSQANDEKEMWNIVNEVSNPKKETDWKLNVEEEITEDGEVIASSEHIDNFKYLFICPGGLKILFLEHFP